MTDRPKAKRIDLPRFLNTEDLAARFGCHPRTVRNWIETGCSVDGNLVKLPASRVGKRWLVREDWLASFEHQLRPFSGRSDLDVE